MNFQKPRYRWDQQKGMYIVSTDITKTESTGVPAWMQAASTGAKIGNIDQSDLKPPQLKMLAGMSPEVMNGTPGASPGNFWMTILNQNLGREVTGSLILLRKSYQIWAPKGLGSTEQRGPLASATDGVNWDQPNQSFEVRFPNNPNPYTWRIGKSVSEFGVTKFGSSQPEDPRSKPIATLTYNMLWLVDLPSGRKQLCVLIASRTMTTPTQNFVSTMSNVGVDHYWQRYRLVQQKKTGPTGDPYFVYEYQFIGIEQDEKTGQYLKSLYDQYAKSGFVVDIAAEAEELDREKGPLVREAARHDEEEIPF